MNSDLTAAFAPKVSLNPGIAYQLDFNQTLGSSIRYVGPRVDADSAGLLDVNYEYHTDHYNFYVTVKNLLDDDILYPDIQNYSPTHLVPGVDDRRLEIGLRYRF